MMNTELNHMYKVAAYERLSKEDDRKEESSSIESQRMIIESFAKFNKFKIVKHYSDDGFTGSNFNRPGFESLKRDIEAKKIDCVIVKDLSRLGRELYLTGSYIEEYFISKNVRFIAINDGYDSLIGDSMLGIRLSVNDMYLRDTSKKIRSSFDVRRKNGDYIGSYAKYGYMKDPNNSKHLIPDPNTAPIVKMMYEWALDGDGTNVIASKLTNMKIPIPSIYKKENRPTSNSELNEGNGIWRPQTVKDILSDEMYLGHMVQGKWKKLSYNSKKLVSLPKNEWIIVKNTHEPLINQETFDEVQKFLLTKARYVAQRNQKHLLQGLLFCKDCGYRMSISKKSNCVNSYVAQCNHYTKYGKHGICSSHAIRYDYLEEDILALLREIGEKVYKEINVNDLINQAEKNKPKQTNEYKKRIKEIELEIKKINITIDFLYQDRLNNIITVEKYVDLSNQQNKKIKRLTEEKEKLMSLNGEIDTPKDTKNKLKKCKKLVEECMYFKSPNPEILKKVIHKIEVDKDRNVQVFFKTDFSYYLDSSKEKGEK